MCRCDGDVICVGHDLNWCSGSGMSAVYILNSVGERTHLVERQFLIGVVRMCDLYMLCRLCVP